MYAVPKDTQLLIFSLPIDASTVRLREMMKKLEADLTKQTGIPSIVLDAVIYPDDRGDFDVRSLKEPEKPIEHTGVVFGEKTEDEGSKAYGDLNDCGLVGTLRNLGLLSLKFHAFNFLSFFLGLLVCYLSGF